MPTGPAAHGVRAGAVKAFVPLLLLIVGVFVIVYFQNAPSRGVEASDDRIAPVVADEPGQSDAALNPSAERAGADAHRAGGATPISPAPENAGERVRARRIDNRAEPAPDDRPGQPSDQPDRYGPNYPQNRTAVQMGGETFQLEVAFTNRDRYFGLSGRESIDTNGGMLFAFRRARVQQFVMRDCLVPIDIAFMRGDGTVVRTYTMPIEPRFPGEADAEYERRLTRYSSIEPVELVAEFKAGTLARLGVEPGDVIEGQYALFTSLAEEIPDVGRVTPN